MRRNLKLWATTLTVVLLSAFAFTACDGGFTVTLDYGYDSKIETIDQVSGAFTLPVPARDGFSFDGWTSADGTKANSVVSVKENVTFKAVWIGEITLTLDYGYDDKTEIVRKAKGDILTLATPVREGYFFAGWKAADGDAVGNMITVNAAATYTAQWTKTGNAVAVFKVPEDADPVDDILSYISEEITLPEEVIADGMTFRGWKDVNGEIFEAGATYVMPYAGTLTFTAVMANNAVVAFQTDGATPPSSFRVFEGNVVTLPDGPVRTGYTFKGWSFGGKTYRAGDEIVAAAGRSNFVGVYKQNLSIIFRVGGEKVLTVSACEGDRIELPEVDVQNGLILKAWIQNSDEYGVGETIEVSLDMDVFDAKLANAYLVTFYAEDNRTIVDSQWIEEGHAAKTPVYRYPAQPGEKWWLTFNGFGDIDNITSNRSVYPQYDYIATSDSFFRFEEVKNGTEVVAYEVYKAAEFEGLNCNNYAETLLLPEIHLGLPVIGIYNENRTSTSDPYLKRLGFASNASTVRVFIPSSYSSISSIAFTGCSKLETVKFAEGSSVSSIEKYAFLKNSALREIEIPNSVTEIQSNAFQVCPLLENVKFEAGGTEGLSFGDSAFSACEKAPTAATYACSLTSFTFPARTVEIGARVFQYNMCMREINFERSSFPLTIKDNAFNASASTPSGTSAATKLYPMLISEITVPARTVYLGKNAFNGQIFVKSVSFELNAMETFGDYAFANLFSLSTINFTDNIKVIPVGAFAVAGAANSWYTHEAPATLTSPAEGEFGGKGYGNEITSLTIPNTVVEIGKQAFVGLFQVRTLKVASTTLSNLAVIGEKAFYLNTNNGYNTVLKSFTYPQSLVTLGDSNFQGFLKISSVTFDCPNLVAIGGSVYRGDARVYDLQLDLTVDFKNTPKLETIGNYAFQYTKLKAVKFYQGNAVGLSIGKFAFAGDWSYSKKVDSSDTTIQSVTLPKYLIAIDPSAFKYLKSLTTFVVEDGNEDYFADEGLLYERRSNGDTLFNVPWLKTGTLSVKDGVTIIGTFAARGCMIDDIVFNDVLTVEKNAFEGCTEIQKLTIPNTVDYVADNAFTYTDSLREVTVSCRELGNAFNNCYALERVTFTKDVKAVGKAPIGNCLNYTTKECAFKVLFIENDEVLTAADLKYGVKLSNMGTEYRIVVASDEMISRYAADELWSEVLPYFTTPVQVTFKNSAEDGSDLVVKSGKGGLLPFAPQAGDGFVWMNGNVVIDLSQPIQSDMVLVEKKIAENETVSATFIANGKEETIHLLKGTAVAVPGTIAQTVNGSWRLVADGKPASEAFDFTSFLFQDTVFQFVNTYQVTFTGTDTLLTLDRGSVIAESDIPAAGENFVWTADGRKAFDFKTAITSNVTLHRCKLVTVTFSGSEAEGTDKVVTILSGNALASAEIPAAGENFVWSLDGTTVFDVSQNVSENIVLNRTASVFVTFKSAGTDGGDLVVAVIKGQNVSAVDMGSKGSWHLLADGKPAETAFDFDTAVDTAIVLEYVETVTVTLKGTEIKTLTLVKGKTIDEKDVPAEAEGFVWSADGIHAFDFKAAVNSDVEINRRQWIAVTFEGAGTGETPDTVLKFISGNPIELSEIPALETGYAWIVKGETKCFDFSKKIASDLNFVKSEIVTVTFKEGAEDSDLVFTIVKGQKTETMAVGEGFGWSVDGLRLFDFEKGIDADTELSKVRIIEVTFDVSGVETVVSFVRGQAVEVPAGILAEGMIGEWYVSVNGVQELYDFRTAAKVSFRLIFVEGIPGTEIEF